MMNKNRTIEEVFSQARQTQPAPLYSIQQVEAMLSASSAQPVGTASPLFSQKKVLIGVASLVVLAGIISASWWWSQTPNGENSTLPQISTNENSLQNSTKLSVPLAPIDTASKPQPINSPNILQNNSEKQARIQPESRKMDMGTHNPKQKLQSPATIKTDNSSSLRTQVIEQHGNTKQSINQDSILGIQKIQLTQEELRKIGLVFDENRIFIKTQDEYGNQFRMTTFSIDSNDYYDEGTNYSDAPSSSIIPVIVASHWNQGINTYKSFLHFPNRSATLDSLSISQKELEREALEFNNISSTDYGSPFPNTISDYPKLSKLIPIYIRLGNSVIEGTNKKYGADIYLWYYPTPEFVAALPSRYRIPLQQELDVITDVVECKMPVGQVCERITGEKTFFDFCRKSSGSIAMVQTYPNPASDQLTCRYQLTNQRSITITLHELSGKFIRELMTQQNVTAGIHEPELQLGDVAPGAYLVAVKTDTGDQAIQRIIVQQ